MFRMYHVRNCIMKYEYLNIPLNTWSMSLGRGEDPLFATKFIIHLPGYFLHARGEGDSREYKHSKSVLNTTQANPILCSRSDSDSIFTLFTLPPLSLCPSSMVWTREFTYYCFYPAQIAKIGARTKCGKGTGGKDMMVNQKGG